MSKKVSLGAAAEQTGRFMRREGALVLPVAFATFGIAFILLSLVMPEPNQSGQVESGLWALAVFPLVFFVMIGQIAIAYMVLRPGVSVRDALTASMKRLPTLIGVSFLLIGIVLGLMLLLSLLFVATGANAEAATGLVALVVLIVMLVLAVRLMMLWPLLADTREGVMSSIRASLRLSKSHFWKFLAVVIVSTVLMSIGLGAVQLGLGSVLLIAGRLVGAEGAAILLSIILVAMLSAAVQAFVAVFLANIYRQLTAPVAQTRPS